jgi:hypothetical protein
MKVALKEWALVIEALGRGAQVFLLRKGGIAEGRRGFELRHRKFLFFPTWEHQHAESVKPEYRDLLQQLQPQNPESVAIGHGAEVTDIVPAPSREQFRRLAPHHVWTESFIDVRYGYRPDLPLFLVVVRVYRLPRVVEIANDRHYAGCRSWVDLSEGVSNEGRLPAIGADLFEKQRQEILSYTKEVEGDG